MNAIGLDIGTTTICAAVADVHTGELLESVTAPNNCEINGASFERCQNPQTILEISRVFNRHHGPDARRDLP